MILRLGEGGEEKEEADKEEESKGKGNFVTALHHQVKLYRYVKAQPHQCCPQHHMEASAQLHATAALTQKKVFLVHSS